MTKAIFVCLSALFTLVGCGQGVSFSSTEATRLSAPTNDEPAPAPAPGPTQVHGKVVAYGLWEFGNVLGGDPLVCSNEDSWDYEGLGCVIAEATCPSGQARATRIVDVYRPWHQPTSGIGLVTNHELAELAIALGRSESFLRAHLIRYWEYRCF